MLQFDNQQTPSGCLLIVDGHAYAYRAFYAIRELLSSVTGQPTNAIYGFIRMLAKMQAWVQPTHCAVVWDGGLCAKRMALHPEYKANRPPTPPDLDRQISEIIRFLKAAGIRNCSYEGVEADDLIATLARKVKGETGRVVIASSDKDFLQLVDDQVGLLNPNDKDPRIWTQAEVQGKTGVRPNQVVDWLSLIGDAVDNIPGVPGVGPKTATKLLQQFCSIEGIEGSIENVRPMHVQSALRDAHRFLLRNRELVQLNTHIPDETCYADLLLKEPDYQDLRNCFKEWGFKKLEREMEQKSASLAGSFL